MIADKASSRTVLDHDARLNILTKEGNCIPLSIAHLMNTYERTAEWVKQKGVASLTVSHEKARKYRQCIELLGSSKLRPSHGLHLASGTRGLLHIGGGAKAHCVAVSMEDEVTCVVYDKFVCYTIDFCILMDVCHSAAESNEIVTLVISDDDAEEHLLQLLELKAGASDDDDTEESSDAAEDIPHMLLGALQSEVQEALDSVDDSYRKCPLCPFRAFDRASRLAGHISKYHTSDVNFCPGGSKQFRLLLALWDSDSASGKEVSNDYLSRSAELLRATVVPNLPATSMGSRADKALRLVFQGDGPVYVNVAKVSTGTPKVRRVGNFYYDCDFALLLLRSSVLAAGSLSQTMARVSQVLSSRGCDTTALLPSYAGQWAQLLEDIFYSPGVSAMFSTLLEECWRHGEFESLSVDCTFRMLMSLQGQASYRAPRSVRLMSALPEAEALHATMTIRGKTGAVCALVPIHGESAPHMKQAMVERITRKHRLQVKHIASDDPSRVFLESMRSICPNLAVISLDPMHIVFVFEAPSYRRRTPASTFLRRIMSQAVGRRAKGTLDDLTIYDGALPVLSMNQHKCHRVACTALWVSSISSMETLPGRIGQGHVSCMLLVRVQSA